MEQEEVTTETYTCGLRFNAEPPKCGPVSIVDFEVPMSKMNFEMKVEDFVGENTQIRDYQLTEEEHKRFDAVEGCTPEEIEMAKKVLSKTLSTSNKMRWRSAIDPKKRFTGINSNGVMNDPLNPSEAYKPGNWSPFGASKFGIPKEEVAGALQNGVITFAEAIEILVKS